MDHRAKLFAAMRDLMQRASAEDCRVVVDIDNFPISDDVRVSNSEHNFHVSQVNSVPILCLSDQEAAKASVKGAEITGVDRLGRRFRAFIPDQYPLEPGKDVQCPWCQCGSTIEESRG